MSVYSIIVVTMLQLNSAVWCRPIPIAEPVRMQDTRIMDRCNVKPMNNSEKMDAASIKMAYPPEGTGLFRDPLEVLGDITSPTEIEEAIVEPVRMRDTRIMERCNVKPKDNSEKPDAASVKMAYPPEGTGLFRDPLEMLGPPFPTKKSINTCEEHMKLTADTVSEVRFTRMGEKVCKQYSTNMITDGPVDVKLTDGYCDYSNDAKTLEQIDLATTCTCVYGVKCDSTSSMIVYSLQANSAGFMKVTDSDSNVLLPVT